MLGLEENIRVSIFSSFFFKVHILTKLLNFCPDISKLIFKVRYVKWKVTILEE